MRESAPLLSLAQIAELAAQPWVAPAPDITFRDSVERYWLPSRRSR